MNIQIQKNKVLALLESNSPEGFTRMQVAKCLGIERSSVCARVAELAEEGRIFTVKRGICPVTGFVATFITANKQVAMALPDSARMVKPKKEKTGQLF